MAGKPSGENVNGTCIGVGVWCGEFANVPKAFRSGEVMLEHYMAEGIPFHLEHVLPLHPMRGQVEPSDTGEH